MKEKITDKTRLWLGPRGDISLTWIFGAMMSFTIEELRSGTTVNAQHGEDHCRLVYNTVSERVITVLSGYYDDDDDYPSLRVYTRGSVSIGELLANFLNRTGLELAGVNDEPAYAAGLEMTVTYNHLPTSDRLVPVTETTLLYLTPMGTISLSPAKDHPKKCHDRFTIAKLRSGWDDAVSFDQRMFTGIHNLSGFVGRLTMCKMNDDDDLPWAEMSGLMTYGTLLAQNGLRLVSPEPETKH